ncbi:MAG: alpha/beta hydrolase [Salinivirgaceae bacterium]|nr:alpha/beta hydrolase [Salinivirgaceae bacterium]
MAQVIPYGDNAKAGKYVQSEDAKIYYEVYGKGEPLLLLHGGYYGYISEFEMYLPELINNFKVIAVATRGHGKSEIGKQKMSYALFAEDALKVLKQEGIEEVSVLGFSDGGIAGTVLTAIYPAKVKKIVCMGAGFNSGHYKAKALQEIWEMDAQFEANNLPQFLEDRKKIMPEPERFSEWIEMLKYAWMEPEVLSNEAISGIDCPVLLILGDRDNYIRLEAAIEMYNLMPNSQLCILPNSEHVDLIFNATLLKNTIIPFLTK